MATSSETNKRGADSGGARRPIPTTSEAATEQGARRGRNVRRMGIAALLVFFGLGATGVLGQRTATVTAERAGYRLTVTYPAVTRPGLDVRFNVVVFNTNGLGKKVTLGFRRHYFDIFDENAVRPDPDSVTADGSTLFYSWDDPPGDSLGITIDMYSEFGEHWGVDGSTSVVVDDVPVVTARYHTRWVP
jgi:hypothetical protein